MVVVLSSALGFAFNALSPDGLPLVRSEAPAVPPDRIITLEEAKELWRAGAAVFLDARAADDYAAGHIAGALNLSAARFEEKYPELAPRLAPETRIVAYCDGADCDLSQQLTGRLAELGHTNVQILPNGWTIWRQAGLAIEREER
jgi:rhodanese-related sulfurtransferase